MRQEEELMKYLHPAMILFIDYLVKGLQFIFESVYDVMIIADNDDDPKLE